MKPSTSESGRSRRPIARALVFVVFAAACLCAGAQTQVARTSHNLGASGPGTFRATGATGSCEFCHTPHNANPTLGLWNRDLPGVSYQLYSSSTLKAQLNQPSGSSRLCLSCHDGILALGNLRVAPKSGPVALGPLTGRSVLGTDLSDDHPVSFVYDNALVISRGELADPRGLPSTVRLDRSGQLQCTSCHDPHEDRQPDFLRMDNRYAALCTACHRITQWNGSSHAVSGATWNGAGTNPWLASGYLTVAENGCMSCHRTHAAGHAQRLLAQSAELANCTVCHGGTVAAKNIEAEFSKAYHHPVEATPWVHEPKENPLLMQRHVACADCHNPHAASAAAGAAPAAAGAQRGVMSVTLAGSVIPDPSFGYEVCLKCHGLREPTTLGLTRQSGTRNIRSKIDPGNASYHPLAASGTNPAIQGLEPGYSASSIIACTSCHNNDDWTPGGASPAGPHGSRYAPILQAQYLTADPTVESYQNYNLCYRCHNEMFLVNDQAHTFPHKRHLATAQAPCAACHDAHGSRQNAHLIDFLLRDATGKTVVTPSAVQGRLEYTPLGQGHGQCYLQCHGVNHEPKSY